MASLEYVAERAGDVTQELYRRFAERYPEFAALMSHMDEYMLGRMMQDVLQLVMSRPEEIDDHYLSFEVESHRAYGVTPDMFPPLLRVVHDTAKDHLGEHWTRQMDDAWRQRLEQLHARLADAAQTTG
ncbi:MAG TPA: globin [Pseudomonadales bacterium]